MPEPAGDDAAAGDRPSTVSRRSVLTGLAAVGAFLSVDLGAVAYANNWIRPTATFTRQTIIDGLRAVYGVHPGFRKNHAKGVAVSGYFDSNGHGAALSSAEVFTHRRTPLMGRFSLAGGDPVIADSPAAARGLGLAFGLPGAQQWRTAMLNLPVFPDNSARGFYERALASKVVAGTGKPDPQAMARFLAAHPETAAAMAVIKAHPPTMGFADSTFSSLSTFLFTDHSGRVTPVRWVLFPEQHALPTGSGRDGLFDALVRQLRRTPLRWRMEIVVGEPDDPLDDATLMWPSERRHVVVGTVTLTAVETEAPGNARDVNFDPLVLPDGISASADPLLSARSSTYAASYRLRAGESTTPSAVQVDEVTQ